MNPVLLWFHQLGSPPLFHRFASRWAPWCFVAALPLMLLAAYSGLWVVPADYQQGDSYRIIFIHVPAAWMSLFIYGVMAVNAFIALVWRIKLSEIIAMSCAPIGAAFTAVCLATGSLWGKPMWGTWWTWDARLTSELVLLFLYLGVMGVYAAIEDRRAAARAACFLALIGVVNVPIVHFSVVWWNTLHQGSTIRVFGESRMDPSMLPPLLAMAVGTKFWFMGSLLRRARAELVELESGKDWVKKLIGELTPTQAASFPRPTSDRSVSGLAIFSLVMGVLGWLVAPLVGPIAAIASGHLARARIQQAQGHLSGEGIAKAGLGLGYLSLGLTVAY